MSGDTGGVGVAATGTGAALASLAASACCVPVVTPLIIAVAGTSGAVWVAGLQPYRPYILAGTAVLLGYGLWTVHRRREACPADHEAAIRKPGSRLAKGALYFAAVVWLASLALPLVAAWL